MAILCLAAECDNLCQSDENKSTSSLVSLNDKSRCLRISEDIDMLDMVDERKYLAVDVRSCTISVVAAVVVVELFCNVVVAVVLDNISSPSVLFMLSKLKEDTSALCFSAIVDLVALDEAVAVPVPVAGT